MSASHPSKPAAKVIDLMAALKESLGIAPRRCVNCKRDMGIEPSAHIGEDFCDTCFAVESGDV